jgi:hypothetical protein
MQHPCLPGALGGASPGNACCWNWQLAWRAILIVLHCTVLHCAVFAVQDFDEENGPLEHTVPFLNFANDPTIEGTITQQHVNCAVLPCLVLRCAVSCTGF